MSISLEKIAGSRSLAEALTEAKRNVDELQYELDDLRQIQNRMFQVS